MYEIGQDFLFGQFIQPSSCFLVRLGNGVVGCESLFPRLYWWPMRVNSEVYSMDINASSEVNSGAEPSLGEA